MRRGNQPSFIYDEIRPKDWPKSEVKTEGDRGLLLGINLSADFCAEHEWGIRGLKQAFGIPEDIGVYGIKRRRMTVIPTGLTWVEFGSKHHMSSLDVKAGRAKKAGDTMLGRAGFVYHQWYGEEPEKLGLNTELYGFGLCSAWSENEFAAVSSDAKDIESLREIYTEIQKGNVVITLSGNSNPFDNSGLVIAIADRLPALVLENWYTADEDHHKMKEEFTATGIEDLLKKVGKRYFALSPRRQPDGSLRYWLNPYDQQENNFGWFTLEELQLWAADEGPIPMKKKESVNPA